MKKRRIKMIGTIDLIRYIILTVLLIPVIVIDIKKHIIPNSINLVGAIIAFILISIESKSFDIPDNFVENLLFYGIIIGILGARIYYVAFEFDAYKNDIWGIFRIWEGGLAIHGGIIAGLLWIIYYCKKMRVKILRMLDIVVVGLILAQSIGRWGNFTNQEAFGKLVNYDELKKNASK